MTAWTRPARVPRTGWPWPPADGAVPVGVPTSGARVAAASDALARAALDVDKLSAELAVAVQRLEDAWLQVDEASDGPWRARARDAIALARATAGRDPT